jgi:hypothetical protein
VNFQVRADKIGVRVCFNNACNGRVVLFSKFIVLLRVSRRVDNEHFAGPDYRIGSMCQAFIVKLLNDHVGAKIGEFRISDVRFRISVPITIGIRFRIFGF